MHGSLRLALTLCLLAGPISAEVSSNHGGPNGGSVRPGDDTDTCAAGNAGAIRYNTNALWYCNGTGPTWTQFASSSGATVTAAGVSGSVQFRDGSGNLAGNANFTTEQNGNQLNIASGTNVVASINVGDKPTGNRTAYIDLAGDATYSDYGLRIIRGNTGANANSDVLHRGTGLLSFWTQDNAPIRFLTSSTEVLRITSNNRVGIGNASPTYLVDIALNSISGGNYLRVGDDDSAGELLIGDGTAAASSFLPVFYAKPVAPARYTGIISQISSTDDTGSIPATQIISRVGANTALATRPTFSVNNYATPQLTILANGNTGIGTSSPAYSLDVSGTARFGSSLAGYTVAVPGNNPTVSGYTAFYTSDSTPIGYVGYGTKGATGYLNFASYEGGLRFLTSSTEAMRITTDNRVGIGNISPANALDVSGTVRFNKANGTSGLAFDPVDDVAALNPGVTTVGSVIQGVGSGHLIFDIRGNDASDAIAMRYSAANSGTPDTVGFVMKNNGRIGVGTVNPSSSLHVVGGEIQPGTSGGACATANNGAMRYTASKLYLCVGTLWTEITTASSTTVNAAGVSGSIQFNSGGNFAGRSDLVVGTTGNVGIGGAPGNAKFQVVNDNTANTYGSYSLYQPTLTGNLGSNIFGAFNQVGLAGNFGTTAGTYGALNRSMGPAGATGNIALSVGAQNDTYTASKNIASAYGSVNAVVVNSTGNVTDAYAIRAGIDDISSGVVTNGYGLFIAAVDATNPWSIYTNDANAPSYFAGNVGIGTASVGQRLNVAGNVSSTSVLTHAGTGPAGALHTNLYDGSIAPFTTGLIGNRTGSNAGADYAIWRYNDAGNFLGQALTIQRSTGNVGIGSSNPSFPLTIASGAAQYPAALYIQPSTHATSRRAGLVLDDWSVVQDSAGNGTKDFNIYQASGNANRLTISNSGNVGIGNVAPGAARLNVYNDNVANSYAAFINNGPTLTSNLSTSLFAVWNQVGLAGNFGTTGTIYGAVNRVNNPLGATGTVAGALGGVNDVYVGSKNINSAFGSDNSVNVNSTGNVGTAFALRSGVSDVGSGVVTTGYGLFIETIQATNPWSIYATDPNAPSYFAGRVGIGGTNGTYKLFVTAATGESAIGGTANGTVNAVYGLNGSAGGNGVLGQNSASGTAGYLGTGNGYGVLCTSGSCGGSVAWTNYSDIRLKERIATLPESKGLALIEQLRPVTYHWKDKRKDARLGEQVGFIAQEVEKLLPEVVSTDPSSTMKSMSYAELVVPLTKAVQELKAENDNLRQRLERLEAARR